MQDYRSIQLSDAEAYFERNGEGVRTDDDPVLDAVRRVNKVSPISSLLEVGCATGWRLQRLHDELGSTCVGMDASLAAISRGSKKYPELDLRQGLAPNDLPELADAGPFSCMILGFFMYLLPRRDLFNLASQVDSMLIDEGHLIVVDFLYPRCVRSEYAHNPGLTTFKMDPTAPWTWSPTYELVERSVYRPGADGANSTSPENWTTVDVLRKFSLSDAYPEVAARPSVRSG
jgi:hypothetical protein